METEKNRNKNNEIENMLRRQEKADDEVKAGKAIVGASALVGTGIVVGAWIANTAYLNGDAYAKYVQMLPPEPLGVILAATTGIGLVTWAIGKHNQKKQE